MFNWKTSVPLTEENIDKALQDVYNLVPNDLKETYKERMSKLESSLERSNRELELYKLFLSKLSITVPFGDKNE